MNKIIKEIGMKPAPKSVNVGLENRVISKRIVAIVKPNSAPIKRMIMEAKGKNMLIDATSGKPTRSAIIMDSRNIVLSSISPRNMSARLDKNNLE